jgi:tetratricopeptide (TPR) repeat protein
MENVTSDRLKEYINGTLNEAEASDIRLKLEQDPELAKHYGVLKDLFSYYEKEDEEELRERLKKARVYNEQMEQSSTGIQRLFMQNSSLILAIAAVLIITLAVYFLLLSRQKSTPSLLHKKYFAHYDHTIQPRDGNNSISNFYNGMQLYKAGSFQKALNSFLNADAKYRQISSFYIGLCYLNLDKYREAIDYLNEAVTLNGDHKEDAEWYLALAYLADGDIEDSERIVKRIAGIPKHYYHEQAKDLLADMAEL